MRPCGNTYYSDRDPSHFRFILNYLRNGAHLEDMNLSHVKRYLMELSLRPGFICWMICRRYSWKACAR